MDDINYDELFGLSSDASAEAEDTAAEEGTETVTAVTDDTESDSTEAAEAAEAPAEAPKKEQTPEERSRQAAGRRLREREEAARAEERGRISEVLARLGLTDPETGDAVDTVDKLEAYERDMRKSRLASGSGTEDDIRAVVREELQMSQSPEKASSQNAQIESELKQIAQMDGDITGESTNDILASILGSDYGDKFRNYVNKGLTFLEAYKLAAGDKLEKARIGKAEEAARVKAASKDHLSSTSSRGQGAVSVPADVVAYYRILMPELTDAEIQKHYNADRKRYGPK